MVGDPERITNAGRIFMNPQDGLRLINSASQIARFEFASIRTSESVLSLVRYLREGVAESELEKQFTGSGLTLSCHAMISFGEKARRGLSSPSENRARLGDAYTVAFGLCGGLTSRAGTIARGPEDLSPDLREFYPRLAHNYFQVMAAWYGSLKVGALGGEVWLRVDSVRDAATYNFALNPGHYLHLDEWVNSPFYSGSEIPLLSGMALQMDIIPVSLGPFCYINGEDGVVLADEALRAELAARYPACWKRIQMRRQFMQEVVGIKLHEDVLPLSNTPGWLAPYALEPAQAFVISRDDQ
jgi:hypothetical protein